MIKQVDSIQELPICLNIIRKSFKTVADEFNLTAESCPKHAAFISPERLEEQFAEGRPMFLYHDGENYIGYFSLTYDSENNSCELHNLSVLPDSRHSGAGKAMIEYAKKFAAEKYGASRLNLALIEENEKLKNWYLSQGFIHLRTQKFPHLPFTIGFMELPL